MVAPEGSPVRDTITVALPGPLSTRGDTLPLGPAARFLAGHLGDTIGTDCEGSSRIALEKFGLAATDPLTLVPATGGRSGPVLILRPISPYADPRDQIDAGVDVLITQDPATLDYAARRGGLRLLPLAWSTTYVLVVPGGAPFPVPLSAALREELARDAVRGEARPAEGLVPGEARCPRSPRAAAGRRDPAIVFPGGDPTARALAERMVALARPLGPTRVRSYPATGIDSLLAGGAAAAFLLPLSRPAFSDCRDMPSIPVGATIASLIEVRATAVVRPGVPAFLILGDGTIRFLPVASR